MMLGVKTVIYRVDDLQRAKTWYARVFEVDPYFDEPFYVGFRVGGFELGLDPDTTEGIVGPGGTVAYWGVEAIDEAHARVVGHGGTPVLPVKDVGGGIRVATVADPFGNLIGLIETSPYSPIGGTPEGTEIP